MMEMFICSMEKTVSLAWQYPTTNLTYIADPVTIGDLDNDNHLDLIYSGGYGEVDALDRFGGLNGLFMMPMYESSFRGASLADVNNDDTLDVLFADRMVCCMRSMEVGEIFCGILICELITATHRILCNKVPSFQIQK